MNDFESHCAYYRLRKQDKEALARSVERGYLIRESKSRGQELPIAYTGWRDSLKKPSLILSKASKYASVELQLKQRQFTHEGKIELSNSLRARRLTQCTFRDTHLLVDRIPCEIAEDLAAELLRIMEVPAHTQAEKPVQSAATLTCEFQLHPDGTVKVVETTNRPSWWRRWLRMFGS